jgi:D-sedoheptulose 7-phosphate isomerase
MNIDPGKNFKKIADLLVNVLVTDHEGRTFSSKDGISQVLDSLLHLQGKAIIIGNGGSAAIASHLNNDLCNAVGVRSMVFNDPSQLTALSNDHGYNVVFERPTEMWGDAGDVFIAISSSGQSENILRATKAARKRGCHVFTFSGFEKKNPLRQLGHLNFYIPSTSYGEVEVAHMSLTHYVTDCAMMIRQKTGALS